MKEDTLHEDFLSYFVFCLHLLTRNWLWICPGT